MLYVVIKSFSTQPVHEFLDKKDNREQIKHFFYSRSSKIHHVSEHVKRGQEQILSRLRAMACLLKK